MVRARIRNQAFGRQNRNQIAAFLNQGFESFLAGHQRLFRKQAVGDIDAHHESRFSSFEFDVDCFRFQPR